MSAVLDGRRGSLAHYGGRFETVLGCGLAAVGRRRTLQLAAVTCAGCRASRDFKSAVRAAEKLRAFQERCGASGHMPRPDAPETCMLCGASREVPRG